MALGDAFQDSTDKALEVMATLPLEPEKAKPKRSAWSVIPRAVAAAGAELAGNALDVAGAYGQTVAATGVMANPMLPDDAATRKERLEVFDKLKTDGIDWRAKEAQPAYEFARDLRPDPLAAGAAESIIFGLTKGLTKAIGAGVAMGPIAGAGVFGTSEGMTTAEDLAVQGVDQATRTKAGVVSGAAAAVGIAIPASIGASRLISSVVGAVVNPALGATQRAAVSSILENADYATIAKQFDPLDPTMLAIEAVFGWVVGGAFYRPKISAKPARVDAPATAPDAVLKDSLSTELPKPVATQEQVDAAMVHNLTLARDAHEANAANEANGLLVALRNEADALADVRVIEPPKLGAGKTASLADPLYRQALETMAKETGWAETGGRLLREMVDGDADQGMGIGTGKVIGRTPWVPNAEWWPGRPKGMTEAKTGEAIRKALAGEPLKAAEQRMVDYMLDYAKERVVPSLRALQDIDEAERAMIANDLIAEGLDTNLRDIVDVDAVAKAARLDEVALEKAAVMYQNDDAGFMKEVERIIRENARTKQDAKIVGRSQADQSASDATGTARTANTKDAGLDLTVSSILTRAEALKAEQPDMPVAVRDDGTVAKFADELDAIRKQAKEGTDVELGADDAPLLKVAAECFLSIGAAAA
jgi:hypothetical protein